MNKDMHVVVLMGGWSSEREVSLTSGRGVAAAKSRAIHSGPFRDVPEAVKAVAVTPS